MPVHWLDAVRDYGLHSRLNKKNWLLFLAPAARGRTELPGAAHRPPCNTRDTRPRPGRLWTKTCIKADADQQRQSALDATRRRRIAQLLAASCSSHLLHSLPGAGLMVSGPASGMDETPSSLNWPSALLGWGHRITASEEINDRSPLNPAPLIRSTRFFIGRRLIYCT